MATDKTKDLDIDMGKARSKQAPEEDIHILLNSFLLATAYSKQAEAKV